MAAEQEARLIFGALTSIGCHVQIFRESCDEAERVLNAYLKTLSKDRHGPTHSAILRGEVQREYVRALASDFEGAAERFGVKVRHTELSQFPNDHKYFPLEQYNDLISVFAWEHMSAREHDAYAVAMTMRLRRGKHYSDPLKNSHVFVSSNAKMVAKARRYCLRSGMIQSNQIGPAIDTRDLATTAWLRTGFAEEAKLPVAHMLAQCERVLRVRKDVIESARAQVAKADPSRVEQFDLLLQNNRAVVQLMDHAFSTAPQDNEAESIALLDSMLAAAIEAESAKSRSLVKEKQQEISRLRREKEETERISEEERMKLVDQI